LVDKIITQNYKKYKDGYRRTFIKEFLKQIEQSESFTIFGMPETGKNDLFQNFAKNKVFWESIFPEKECNFLIIYIDLKKLLDVSPLGFYRLFLYTIYKTTLDNIKEKSTIEQIKNIYTQTSEKKELFSIFESCEEIIKIVIEKTNLKLCILIYDIATISSFKQQFFNSLKALRNVNVWKIILSFASDSNILRIMGPELLSDLYNLIRNKNIWLKLPSYKDSILIMEEWERENNYRIPKKVKNIIYRIANGHPGFMKSINNIYQEKKDISCLYDIKKLSKQSSIIARGDKFWTKLNNGNKNILMKLVNDPRIKVKAEYLNKTGIINKENKMFSQILEEYIKNKSLLNDKKDTNTKENDGTFIDIKTKTTYINNQKLKDELTDSEFKILLHLYNSKGNIVSKDEIAKILWKNEAIKKYSDWAIDKTISRLRIKIGDSAKNSTFIETLKGRGLRLLK